MSMPDAMPSASGRDWSEQPFFAYVGGPAAPLDPETELRLRAERAEREQRWRDELPQRQEEARRNDTRKLLREHVLHLVRVSGIDDAFVMEPGQGTVHVPTPTGSAFLSNLSGDLPDGEPGLRVGLCWTNSAGEADESEVWRDADATTDITEAAAQLIATATAARDRVRARPTP